MEYLLVKARAPALYIGQYYDNIFLKNHSIAKWSFPS
jgi:hypothetical protein